MLQLYRLFRPLYSGSSGHDHSGGGGGGGIPIGCLEIAFVATLASPNIEVIAKLKPRDVLSVVSRKFGPREILLAVTNEGEEAGAITHDDASRIFDCIAEGHEYLATVLEVRGAFCKVAIRAKAKHAS